MVLRRLGELPVYTLFFFDTNMSCFVLHGPGSAYYRETISCPQNLKWINIMEGLASLTSEHVYTAAESHEVFFFAALACHVSLLIY